ncbi:MAG: hypothetical protein MK291_08830 [Planctomycetes bacterium]|nr:hypothetical protein [Planctomycetota bacterium]
MFALQLLLSLLLSQEPPAPTPPVPADEGAAEVAESPQASWEALAKATFAEEPVKAFDLAFHLRVRPDDIQTNDLAARYRFLSPGYVRATLESGREHLRGPDGDYLIDGEEVLKLVGREAAEDKKQLDEAVGVAKNFMALTDIARLKPKEVSAAAPPMHLIPAELQERAAGLRWISIRTDGFHLLSSTPLPEGARREQRALLGLHRTDPTLSLSVIIEDTLGADGLPLSQPQLVLLDLRKAAALDGFQVPRHLRVHGLELKDGERRFRAKPAYELWLRGGTLRPTFAAESFKP